LTIYLYYFKVFAWQNLKYLRIKVSEYPVSEKYIKEEEN